MTATHKTYCRNCQAACGMELTVENNRIVSARGDPGHPMSAGYSCIKGQYSKDFHNGDDRIVDVLRRGRNGFETVSLDIALDDIAARLKNSLRHKGPRSIALYCGTALAFAGLSGSMAKSWLAGVGSPEYYSNFTVDQSAKWVTIGRMGVFGTGKHTIDDIDVMLLFGYNPLVSHMGYPLSPIPASNPLVAMNKARERGAKIIVVDPRQTETARKSDIHLAIRPSEDATLVAAMIRVVFEKGWQDRGFCTRFVTSVDRLRDAVQPFTLEYAASRTGIDAKDIARATEIFATARRKVAASGTGSNMCERSNLVEHLVESLNAICGNFRRAGDPLRATGAIFDMMSDTEKVIPPNRMWENPPYLRSAPSGRIMGEFPSTRLPDEILHRDNPIRTLVVAGGNPATALADRARVSEALGQLDLLVVLDSRMSETAEQADYVIPAKLAYERDDMTTYADNWFSRNFAHFAPAALRAPGGMLEDWEIFWELACRMGTPLPFKAGPYGVPRDWLPDAIDLDTSGPRPSSEDLFRMICSGSRADFDRIKNNPSGLIVAEAGIVRKAEEDDGARLDICPDDVQREITALANEVVVSNEYGYRLTTRRSNHVINSAFKNGARVRRRFNGAPVHMNPEDMLKEGISDGDKVLLVSAHGRLAGRAVPDKALRPGVISMSACWGSTAGHGETTLTSSVISSHVDVEQINFMPLQSGTWVSATRMI